MDLKQSFDIHSSLFVIDKFIQRNPNTKSLYHFKISFRMIIHQMRIESFSTRIRERLGQLPGLITKMIMNSSLLHGLALQVGTTEPLTLIQITALLPSNSSLDLNKLGNIMDQMASDQLKPIRRMKQSDGDTKYSVALSSILRHIQLKTIETLVEKQFGDKFHVRVFRAIQALGMANEKQIEDTCLMSLKQVRKVLMELVVFGLLEQHELNMNKGVYCYSVKISGFVPLLREKVLKVILIYFRAS